jgi:RNA 3'-terminal phosphate cyclase (ATP)
VVRIDGSLYSGSGTVLRYAAALATLTGKPLNIHRIRARREKPGLRPQHLTALRACCSLSGGRLEGDQTGSEEIFYFPGETLRGGHFSWDIGTAGSATMLAFTVVPLGLFAESPCRFSITGGLFQDNAPSAFHMQRVLLPLLRRMGGDVQMEVQRPGYVPKGQGRLEIRVKRIESPLQPLRLLHQGNVKEIRGISLASHLTREKVSDRMAERCRELLSGYGFTAEMEVLRDDTAAQKGAALLVYAETDKGCLMGADIAGKLGRRSEHMAQATVDSLMQDMGTGATTDRHLADQLILFGSLAGGGTEYLIPRMTDHVESNLWLVNEFLGAGTGVAEQHVRIDGVGFYRDSK